MCIATLQTKGTPKISNEVFETMFNNNPHGFGVSYFNKSHMNKELTILKSLNFHESLRMYNQVHAFHGKNSHIMLHFRVRTHGVSGLFNTHPFYVGNRKEMAFCHNGIIGNVPNHKIKSDTQVFNDLALKKLPRNFIHSEKIISQLREFIGGWNKIIFLTHDNFKILNENGGIWKEGVWYSNKSFLPNRYDIGGDSSSSQCDIDFNY